MSRVAFLFRPGGPPMSCPPDPLLLLHDAGELPEDIAEGWTEDSLREHVAACRRCRRGLAGWQRSLDSFRDLDVVDTSTFDDAFFDDLAREVDEALGRKPAGAEVLPLRRRPSPRAVWPAAAVLALALVVGTLRPEEAPTLAESEDPRAETLDDSLVAEGRALGQEWLTEALGEEPAERMAWTDIDSDSEDDRYPFATSFYDDLDDLSGDELAALFTRL